MSTSAEDTTTLSATLDDGLGDTPTTGKQSSWWWFTIQCETDAQALAWELPQTPKYKYAIWRAHAAPTTGKPHVHVLVQYTVKQRFSTMQNKGYKNLKYCPTRQYQENNRNYVITDIHKDKSPKNPLGPYVEKGTWAETSQQGRRNDLLEVTTKIKEGASLKRVAEEHPDTFVRYYRGFEKFKAITVDEDKYNDYRPLQVIWSYGDSGAGKSELPFRTEKKSDVYDCPRIENKKLWLDGYDGQKILVLDDMVNTMTYHLLLKICNPRVSRWPNKGGFVPGIWEKIYISFQRKPEDLFSMSYDRQLERRITSVYKWVGEYPNSGVIIERGPDADTTKTIPADEFLNKKNNL